MKKYTLHPLEDDQQTEEWSDNRIYANLLEQVKQGKEYSFVLNVLGPRIAPNHFKEYEQAYEEVIDTLYEQIVLNGRDDSVAAKADSLTKLIDVMYDNERRHVSAMECCAQIGSCYELPPQLLQLEERLN